jgi:starvation-inducible outer membrane lipoprotein
MAQANGRPLPPPASKSGILFFYFFILANCSTQPPQLDTENENKNLKKKRRGV